MRTNSLINCHCLPRAIVHRQKSEPKQTIVPIFESDCQSRFGPTCMQHYVHCESHLQPLAEWRTPQYNNMKPMQRLDWLRYWNRFLLFRIDCIIVRAFPSSYCLWQLHTPFPGKRVAARSSLIYGKIWWKVFSSPNHRFEGYFHMICLFVQSHRLEAFSRRANTRENRLSIISPPKQRQSTPSM